MEADSKYRLTVSKAQLLTLQRALDLFSRLGIGQYERLIEMRMADAFDKSAYTGAPNVTNVRARVEAYVDALKRLLFGMPINASFGIPDKSVPVDYRRAYEMHGTFRRFLALEERSEGGIEVSFDEPLHLTDEAMPEIAAALPVNRLVRKK